MFSFITLLLDFLGRVCQLNLELAILTSLAGQHLPLLILALGLQACAIMPGFYVIKPRFHVSARDLNLGSHSWTANTLAIEPSLYFF